MYIRSLPDDLYKSGFAALAGSQKERDIASVSELWNEQIHSPHAGIPFPDAIAASVT